ncbi:pleckstrin homology domain-containing family S member 1-like [Ctenopharyngodon idella]|uniref:pleckstrin homology domain-containing family S member 1-like n=1 Tax=Ctenopharyngodon idella TaxID=7959 RepID=UPI00222F4E06|nr:pleckstrin homology domain-containing family S member 1-like [Ctenopharyngodon idella]
MSKPNKNATATAKFYKEPAMVEEVYTGYLQKSPGQSAVLKSVKSWKQRFFVLSKTGEDAYHLTYYTNNEKRDKSVGKIDLSKISLLFTGPEKHQMWDWIQKHFSCTPASVLFLRVEDDTPKHARDYFLIGENSNDVNGWHNALVKALKTHKPNKLRHTDDTLEYNRCRSTSAPLNDSEPKVKDEFDERWSAPELMLSSLPPNHYDYPRKFSEPLVPAERKISVKEDEDEKDGKQDESPEDSSEYMSMASLQMKLEDDQQEADTARIQTNTSINGHESSLCNSAVTQDKDYENKRMSTDSQHRLLSFNENHASTELDELPLNKSETHTHVEKEICVSPNSLKNSLILTQEEGKPCVSECRQIQDSCLFHKGDQILAFNGLRIDTVEDIQTYLRKLSKDEVKLTIRRFPGSQPLHSESCISQ